MAIGDSPANLDAAGIEDLLAEFGQGIEQEGDETDEVPAQYGEQVPSLVYEGVPLPMANNIAGQRQEVIPESFSDEVGGATDGVFAQALRILGAREQARRNRDEDRGRELHRQIAERNAVPSFEAQLLSMSRRFLQQMGLAERSPNADLVERTRRETDQRRLGRRAELEALADAAPLVTPEAPAETRLLDSYSVPDDAFMRQLENDCGCPICQEAINARNISETLPNGSGENRTPEGE